MDPVVFHWSGVGGGWEGFVVAGSGGGGGKVVVVIGVFAKMNKLNCDVDFGIGEGGLECSIFGGGN